MSWSDRFVSRFIGQREAEGVARAFEHFALHHVR
ncbi:cell division protein FtsW, partial [Burkholderia gladioli]